MADFKASILRRPCRVATQQTINPQIAHEISVKRQQLHKIRRQKESCWQTALSLLLTKPLCDTSRGVGAFDMLRQAYSHVASISPPEIRDRVGKLHPTHLRSQRMQRLKIEDILRSFGGCKAGNGGLVLDRTVLIDVFSRIDKNNDGVLSRAEVIKSLRHDPDVRRMLDLPQWIRQEDGTRDQFERVFQSIDSDDSKTINVAEFARFFDRQELSQRDTTVVPFNPATPPRKRRRVRSITPPRTTAPQQSGSRRRLRQKTTPQC